jgi:hypothetical protein
VVPEHSTPETILRQGTDLAHPSKQAEFWLRSKKSTADNNGMTIKGRVHDGVIVLPEGVTLPEGTEVIVSCESGEVSDHAKKKSIQFPLVHSRRPGMLQLTPERVAEFLNEDVPSRH